MPDPQLESERIEELTQALRAVMERVRTTRAPAEVLDRAARTLRTLAADLGSHLGCGAHLKSLRRVRSGPFTIADALVRLLAPVLPHTADEAWHALHPGTESTVHVALLPGAEQLACAPKLHVVAGHMKARPQLGELLDHGQAGARLST